MIKMISFVKKCQDDLGESSMNTESMQERIVCGDYCIFVSNVQLFISCGRDLRNWEMHKGRFMLLEQVRS